MIRFCSIQIHPAFPATGISLRAGFACRKFSRAAIAALFAAIPLGGSPAIRAAEPEVPRTLNYVVEKSLNLVPSGPQDGAEAPWVTHLLMNARSLPHNDDGRVVTRIPRGTTLAGNYIRIMETDEEWLEIDHEGEPAYIARIGLTRPHPANLAAIAQHGNLTIGEEIVSRWWGIPITYEPDDMVEIAAGYCLEPQPPSADRSEGGKHLLRAEAAESLAAMLDEMEAAGIPVFVSSAYRSGATQRRLYLSATRRRAAQRGTAPPGHSEHQLATTVDFSTEKAERRSLRNTDEAFEWLAANAARFGWHQTYRADNRELTGYIEEPWHWRYMGAAAGR